jgi:hypothetical protein
VPAIQSPSLPTEQVVWFFFPDAGTMKTKEQINSHGPQQRGAAGAACGDKCTTKSGKRIHTNASSCTAKRADYLEKSQFSANLVTISSGQCITLVTFSRYPLNPRGLVWKLQVTGWNPAWDRKKHAFGTRQRICRS